MAKLIVAGTPHELAEDLLTIGRAAENSIVINDVSVSGRHAQLERVGDVYKLRDLESANGTRVNGESTRERTLRQGDRIRFGAVEACFEEVDLKSTQPVSVARKMDVTTAEESARPTDFANASPFRSRKSERDLTRTLLFAFVGIAFLALIVALVMIFLMRSPTP